MRSDRVHATGIIVEYVGFHRACSRAERRACEPAQRSNPGAGSFRRLDCAAARGTAERAGQGTRARLVDAKSHCFPDTY